MIESRYVGYEVLSIGRLDTNELVVYNDSYCWFISEIMLAKSGYFSEKAAKDLIPIVREININELI